MTFHDIGRKYSCHRIICKGLDRLDRWERWKPNSDGNEIEFPVLRKRLIAMPYIPINVHRRVPGSAARSGTRPMTGWMANRMSADHILFHDLRNDTLIHQIVITHLLRLRQPAVLCIDKLFHLIVAAPQARLA